MQDAPIEGWWPNIDIDAKQWLREHQGAAHIPEAVLSSIKAAGGTSAQDTLADQDWQFISTQSESVD